MLKVLNQDKKYKVEIYHSVSSEDVLELKELLNKDFYLFSINFTCIYNIPASLTQLLYEQIVVLQKNINIVVDKSRLSRYLNSIGIKGVFFSKLKDEVFDLEDDNIDEWMIFLLEEIYIKYEYDFRLYQRDSLKRRVKQFMIKNKISNAKKLAILVLFDKFAFKSLFLDLSINVTEFFRDIRASEKMIETITKNHKYGYKIKIWSAGCSSGEEAYSTAIILNELGLLHKSIIYATDFNPVVIEEAKSSIYSIKHFKKAKKTYAKLDFKIPLESYFEINTNFVKVKEFLKQNVLFFVHNLEQDSMFNEFDMIECKNVMIYFDEELKQNILKMFYDSLKFGGHLFLGSSEILPTNYIGRFEVCDDISKIYKKVA